MRTLVDIPEKELKQLTRLSKAKNVSRAHLVRCAIQEYLQAQKDDSLEAAFGMWADRGIDGLEYQLKLRAEWDRQP
jgi:metal-responsive CopG/Arc/MetJ family transcriptional regulator